MGASTARGAPPARGSDSRLFEEQTYPAKLESLPGQQAGVGSEDGMALHLKVQPMGCISTALRRQNHCGRSVLSVPMGPACCKNLQLKSRASRAKGPRTPRAHRLRCRQPKPRPPRKQVPFRPETSMQMRSFWTPFFACVSQTSECTIDIDVEVQDGELCFAKRIRFDQSARFGPRLSRFDMPAIIVVDVGGQKRSFFTKRIRFTWNHGAGAPVFDPLCLASQKVQTHQLPPQFLLPFKRTPQRRQDPPCERSRTTRPQLTSATRSSREATRASTRTPRRTSGAARAPRGGVTSSRTARCRP